MRKAVMLGLTILLVVASTLPSVLADDTVQYKAKASSGKLQKGVPYTIRMLTEAEIAENERYSETGRDGVLLNGMQYTYMEMREKSKIAFNEDGTNLSAGANGAKIWYGDITVPVLNKEQTNGKQIGEAFRIPTDGVEKRVLIDVGALPDTMQSVNISISYTDSSSEEWIMNIPAYSILAVTPIKGTHDSVKVKVSTNEKSSQQASFSIYTTYNLE